MNIKRRSIVNRQCILEDAPLDALGGVAFPIDGEYGVAIVPVQSVGAFLQQPLRV